MQTIFVSPDFPLNRRMRKAVRRGKLQVVREGEKCLSLGGGMPVESRRAFRTHSSPLVCMADNGAESGGVGGDDAQFVVDRKTALELFQEGAHYWVPVYQRVYRWSEEQWEDFWEDITTENESQYVGNIVLRQDERDANRFETVDGQQRLTTIVLYAIAAIRVLAGRRVPNPAKDLAEIFLAESGSEIMKMTPHSDNVHFLAELMKIHPPFNGGFFRPRPDVGNPSQTQMKKAVQFFIEKIEQATERFERPEDVRAFVEGQMSKVVVSRVVAGHEVNPHPLFAALNTRGVPLTVPELIKNHFLSLLANNGKRQEFENWWKGLTVRIGRGERPTPRTGEKELPAFLRAVFICRYGYVRKGRLYKKIVEKVRDDIDVESFRALMDEHAGFYRAIVAPLQADHSWPRTVDKERVDVLSTLPGAQVSVAFLLAARQKFNEGDFSEALRYCYAIGLRNKICGRGVAAQVPDIAYNMAAHEVYQGKLNSPEEAAKAGGRLGSLYKENDAFKSALLTFGFNEAGPALLVKKNKQFLEHFFVVLEKRLGNNRFFDPENIRHIKGEKGVQKMRLGNWMLWEPDTGESQSRYETTRQTVGLDIAARQERLAQWAAEVPDWRIDCLEGE